MFICCQKDVDLLLALLGDVEDLRPNRDIQSAVAMRDLLFEKRIGGPRPISASGQRNELLDKDRTPSGLETEIVEPEVCFFGSDREQYPRIRAAYDSDIGNAPPIGFTADDQLQSASEFVAENESSSRF